MVYRFDDFVVNHRLREVYLRGELLNVEPKVYELIIFFLENANQAITKDALQDAVWPSVVVSETAMTRAIMKARKVLSDPNNPGNYIQTIHGHGYKFIADHITTETAEEKHPQARLKNTSPLAIRSILGLLVLMSFIAVGVMYISQLKPAAKNDQLMVLPVLNQVQDDNYSWASLGLMALSGKIIEAHADVWVMPEKDSLKALELLGEPAFPLTAEQVNAIKNKLSVDYLVASRLSQLENQAFELSFEVYHPRGVFSDARLKGDNPTELVQTMSSQIAQLLPGEVTKQNQVVISDDAFTNELYSRGMSFHLQGFVDKAQNYFELAIEQDGRLLLPKYELAVVKRKQNKLAESKADLQKLLEDFDSYHSNATDKIKILNSLGVTYLRLLDFDQAMNHFLSAYDLAKELLAHRYVVIAANNMAIVERRRNNNDEARKWASEALSVVEKHKLTNKQAIVYLMGQIERDSGHLDKALSLFDTAYKDYLAADMLKEAAAVLSATGGLLRKKGVFDEAHETIQQALEIKSRINDKLGLTDSYIYDIEIYLEEGNPVKARELLTDLKVFVKENNVTTRTKDLIAVESQLNFLQGDYQHVVDLINNQAAAIKSLDLDMLKYKSLQQLGDSLRIKTWLQEHTHYQTDNNHMMRLYWLDFENFYLEHYGQPDALLESYRKRLELSRLMGNDALTAKLLLKIGHQQLRQNTIDQAQNTLHQLQSMGLNWWQFTLFEALLLNAKQDPTAAELAQRAKAQAKQMWQAKHEAVLNQLLEGLNPVTETALLF